MNVVKTAVLLIGLTALFGAVGLALGGSKGMLIAMGFAVLSDLYAYWNSDRLALSAHGAHEVDDRTVPELVGMVRTMAQRAGPPVRW